MKFGKILGLTLCMGYLLGAHNGRVALWKGDDPEPARVFPYSVSSLPKADQEALKKGIRLESREELYRLIEDYLS